MTAADFLPQRISLPALREAVQDCRGCELYRRATQAVFGEGNGRARAMFVGEQPGDEEDVAGRPFVGPAGRLLDRMLEAAGVPRDEIYLTNAVKHFKWIPRGKKRLHQKPGSREIEACTPWLEAELALVKPEVLVLLGASAAQALLGQGFKVSKARGVPFATRFAPVTFATVHPASLLRIPDQIERRTARALFLREMELVAEALRTGVPMAGQAREPAASR